MKPKQRAKAFLLAAASSVIAVASFAISSIDTRSVVCAEEPAKPTSEAEDPETERDTRLEAMKKLAAETRIFRTEDETKTAVTLSPQPLLRYDDKARGIQDGTLWAAGTVGRPLVLQKLEKYRSFRICSYASLSDGLVEMDWPQAERWASRLPGVEWQDLPGAPSPSENAAMRLAQIKEMAARFTARVGERRIVNEELRLLSRPLHRYSDQEGGLQDGVIFGFATSGTNPDLFLLIELQGKELKKAAWKFAPVRLTCGGLTVRLGGEEVWSAPEVSWRSSKHDTWGFFRPLQEF